MTVKPPPADGALQPARAELADAISALVDRKPETLDGRIVYIDSLYQQLVEAVPGSFLGRTTGSAHSQPPLWVDAMDLLETIDATIRTWQPEGTSTPGRLWIIEQRTWRPQDTVLVTALTKQLNHFANRITALFTENHTKHLPAPCPACNKTVVYHRNGGGDLVRQPALQIGVNGCECQACHTVWGPQLFMHLARVLGYQLPEGILE